MAEPNEWYVDSAGIPFSGDGSLLSPWATLEEAYTGIPRDTANGDKINIKGTHYPPTMMPPTAVDIAAEYGVPTQTAPLILRGYGSSVNDGTRGIMDGTDGFGGDNNIVVLGGTTVDFLYVIDMEIRNAGTARVVDIGDHCIFINCIIRGSTTNGLSSDTGLFVSNCRFTDINANGILCEQSGWIWRCVFDNDTNDSGDMDYAIKLDGDVLAITGFNTIGMAVIENCIFDLDSDSKGINLQSGGGSGESSQESVRCFINNNSFYTSGTGTYGITGTSGAKDQEVICQNNCVEGFATTGFRLRSGWGLFHGGNAGYNNTANFDISGDVVFTWGASTNSALGASPYTNPGTNNWTPVGADVITAAEPDDINGADSLGISQGVDKGAFQKAAAAGSSYYGISQGLHTIETGITT